MDGIFPHIEKYLDLLIDVAKPAKLCLLAVDGVAPKAKLVQQRTRRFLGAHRKKLATEIGQVFLSIPSNMFVIGMQVRSEMEKAAKKTFPDPKSFDQNIITPVSMSCANSRGRCRLGHAFHEGIVRVVAQVCG